MVLRKIISYFNSLFNSDYICSFGPVTGFTIGANKVAMINEWKLAKSLFSKEEFSGRLMYRQLLKL